MLYHPSSTIKFSKPLKLKATLEAEENAAEVGPFEAQSASLLRGRTALLLTIKKNF